MKKVLCMTMCILLLCGCTAKNKYPTDNAYHRDTDHPYPMSMLMNTRNITTSESGFYYWIPYYIFYLDKETMEPVPLCTKPNCLHYEEVDRDKLHLCEAYIESGTPILPMVWYEGSLYTIIKSQQNRQELEIVRISEDGSRRETLCNLGKSSVYPQMLIHRGIMYIAATFFTEDGQAHPGIWTYSLAKPGKRPVCILKYKTYSSAVQYNMTAYGERLYFARDTSTDFKPEFCIYDIQSGTLTTIPTNEDGMYPHAALFVEGKMLLRYLSGDLLEGTYREQTYRCELDGSNQQLLTEDIGFMTSDEHYIYRGGNLWADDADHYLYIYDANYNELDKIDLQKVLGEGRLLSATYHIAEDRVFIEASRATSDHKFRAYCYWFDKAEIGSGNITVHPINDHDARYLNADKQG